MRVVSTTLVVLLLTPYNRGPILDWSHTVAGVVCALAQFLVAGRLVMRRRDRRSWSALAVMFMGGVLAACSLPDWKFDYLLSGESILEVGFALILWEWARELSSLTSELGGQC